MTSITNQTYTNLPENPPDLVSNVVNGPDGPVSYTLGNGLNVYQGYDTLGRLSGRWVCSGPATMNCSGGAQAYGTSATWRGTQVTTQSDSILNQQVTFGYDAFNRLTARTVTSGTVQNYTYAYDRYGNRTQTPLESGYSFNPTYSATTNHITSSGYAYDAAGNMTNDMFHTYTYDAEGNITQVDNGSTAEYVYDAFNQRIHVQTSAGTTEYIYDYAGRRVSSWISPNNQANEGRIYWDGQLVAHRSLEALTYFDHEDTLGTQRIRTNYAGWTASSYLSLPWGDGYTATVNNAGGDQDNLHFSGLERDAESGTEHAQFRNYTSNQGRWLAPDQYTGSYDATNPQSMNRYAYVLNNPMSLLDPSGLFTLPTGPCDPDVSACDPAPDPDPVDPCEGFFGCSTPWLPLAVPPVNQGKPFIIKINHRKAGCELPLQRILLLTIPFDTPAPNNAACNIQRATSGVMGAANLGLAGQRICVWRRCSWSRRNGRGDPAAAVLAVYGTVSIFGQGLTGAVQLYSAATGNYGTAAGVAQIGNIRVRWVVSEPCWAVEALSSERNAGYESAFTAGAGLIDAIRAGGAGLSLAMADHNTAQMSLFGAGGGNALGPVTDMKRNLRNVFTWIGVPVVIFGALGLLTALLIEGRLNQQTFAIGCVIVMVLAVMIWTVLLKRSNEPAVLPAARMRVRRKVFR